MILSIPLLILGVFSMFTLVTGGFLPTETINQELNVTAVINETQQTDFQLPVIDFFFGLDPVFGALLILGTLVLIAGVVGVTVMGTGLSDSSTHKIFVSITYLGIWVMLSVFSFNSILEIPYEFGTVLYIGLTLMYVVGVIKNISGV